MTHPSYEKLKNQWQFIDSPWDLLVCCEKSILMDVSCAFCQIIGFWSAYIFPIVSIFGIVTNTISAYVLNWRMTHRNRQCVYFSFLAMFDSFTVICSGWMWIFLAKGLPFASRGRFYFFTYNQNEISCKIHRYITAVFSCAAVSIFLLASVDRCLAVFWPLKCMNIPLKRAWQTSMAVVAVSIVLMSPVFIFMGHTKTATNITLCGVTSDINIGFATFMQLYILLFSFCGTFQTINIIIVNLALFYRVSESKKVRSQMMAAKCKSFRREMSSCITLMVLSVLFTIGSLPTSITFLLAFLMRYDSSSDANLKMRLVFNIGDIGWHLYMVHQCTSGLIYYWKMPNFRKAVNQIFNKTIK